MSLSAKLGGCSSTSIASISKECPCTTTRESRFLVQSVWLGGRAARLRSAKPATPVQLRFQPLREQTAAFALPRPSTDDVGRRGVRTPGALAPYSSAHLWQTRCRMRINRGNECGPISLVGLTDSDASVPRSRWREASLATWLCSSVWQSACLKSKASGVRFPPQPPGRTSPISRAALGRGGLKQASPFTPG